ncbi:NAD(P)/FAD-dependent oxidoreductase [Rhodovibrionaceae bacterium A322]
MYDIAIIGGALVGSSTAYHLLQRDPGLKVAVIEKDPSYSQAASALSNAMVRLVFSQPENLLMSRYGQEFYGNFSELMARGAERPVLDYDRGGLLIIGNTADQAEDIEVNGAFQRSMGCDIELLDAAEVSQRWPSLNSDDITRAVLSPDAGWIDPHGALTGLRKKAAALGAEFISAEVTGFKRQGAQITTLDLADGGSLSVGQVVNATGAWAGRLCQMLGMTLPVVPLPRMVFYFEPQEPVETLPYIRDGLGVGFRREGKGFISGITDDSLAGDFCFEVRHDWFEDRVWPGLATRVPAFERIRVKNAWVGHYAQNTFDGNMIIGAWPGELENFYVATGFSGHGLQHAPAVGRALSELILDGRFTSLDLSALTYERVLANAPYPERGWKA